MQIKVGTNVFLLLSDFVDMSTTLSPTAASFIPTPAAIAAAAAGQIGQHIPQHHWSAIS